MYARISLIWDSKKHVVNIKMICIVTIMSSYDEDMIVTLHVIDVKVMSLHDFTCHLN